jgi:hypothetical protein
VEHRRYATIADAAVSSGSNEAEVNEEDPEFRLT